jgi:5'-3' exonuclease
MTVLNIQKHGGSMKTLLVDGDWLCFSLACAFTKENPFVEGDMIFDGTLAKSVLDQKIRRATEELGTDHTVFYFSCDRKTNWRRQIVDSYKMNRSGKLSPIGLTPLKDHCTSSYEYVQEPTLEADDLIGIEATGIYKGSNVIYSVDKDFLTIPTHVYNPVKRIIKKQTKVDAFKFFIYQIIIGDSSDGYKGIPGAGPKAAQKLIAENSKNLLNIWEPLLELAKKKKVDEEYLISQGRMAHILQEGDFNFDTKEVALWDPSWIKDMI